MSMPRITTLFLDIGGVLLTNGWDSPTRKRAVGHFKLSAEETEERHHMIFDTFESGKMTLDAYLDYVVFYETKPFTKDQFIRYMHEQSLPIGGSIDFFIKLKKYSDLQVIAVSNEPRELNEYRIKHYKLMELFDAVLSSSFVHMRKPDTDLFKLAIDISQAEVGSCIYVDDRRLFVEVARSLGLHGIHFKALDEVKSKLKDLGLSTE